MVLPLTCGFALIDAGAARVGDLHRAESRLEVLRERKRDLMRCGWDRAADQRAGMIEKGVCLREGAAKPHQKRRARVIAFALVAP